MSLSHGENGIATMETRPIRSAKSGNQAEYESGTNRFYYGGNVSVGSTGDYEREVMPHKADHFRRSYLNESMC